MTMSLARGLTTINTKKPKAKKLTQKDTERLHLEWRQYNKRMRRNNNHSLQFKEFDDYLAYIRGEYKSNRKEEKEFKTYAPTKPYVRNTKEYRSLETSDQVPGFAAKKETQVYSGERQLLGIATLHKSNMVPVFADKKEEAIEIAQMRRN